MSTSDFLFEMGMLAKHKRTRTSFLGTGQQSIADHINRVCYIGYALAQLDTTVDVGKTVILCLFHDIAETRSGDHEYVAQQYTNIDEEKIVHDQTKGLSFGQSISDYIAEYETRQSRESLLAKDADNIEFLLSLKEQSDLGNDNTQRRIEWCLPRIKTDLAKQLAKEILETSYDERRRKTEDKEYRVTRKK